jgi:Fe-S cluster assembly protein SufD
MTANVKVIRTEAETALIDMFEARRSTLPGAQAERQAAIETFARLGLPHRRVESWHYTDLRAAMRVVSPIEAPAKATAAIARNALTQGLRLVVLDGAFRADLSDLVALPAGVTVRALRDVLASSGTSEGLLHDRAAQDDAVVALNSALMQDGAVIDIAPGARIETPLVLMTALTGGQAQASFTRSILRVGEGASVTLVEESRALVEGATQDNAALVIEVGVDAKVNHIARVKFPGAASIHLHSLVITQAKSSTVESFCLVADGGLVRRQIFVRMTGEHATLGLSGLSLLDNARLADTTLVVDHTVPHGTSREFYRHILEGESTGVYQGKVIVRPHAQKTDGGMKSNALVLSDGAAMNNKPELEIFADDVVCGHGATVGQLDEDQLFYLMSRGLPRVEAEALLVEAFGAVAIEKVADERLRDVLLDDLRAWLARRGTRLS